MEGGGWQIVCVVGWSGRAVNFCNTTVYNVSLISSHIVMQYVPHRGEHLLKGRMTLNQSTKDAMVISSGKK